jgi:hypothetical protein
VFSHKETTTSKACKCIFPGQRSDTFWTAQLYNYSCKKCYVIITLPA